MGAGILLRQGGGTGVVLALRVSLGRTRGIPDCVQYAVDGGAAAESFLSVEAKTQLRRCWRRPKPRTQNRVRGLQRPAYL